MGSSAYVDPKSREDQDHLRARGGKGGGIKGPLACSCHQEHISELAAATTEALKSVKTSDTFIT